ncbi:MAG: HEAT repeat domain-containing protein [Stappiaceae bacterium]
MKNAQTDARNATMPTPESLFGTLAKSDHDVVRLKAVQALRDVGAPDSIFVLIEALHDDDEDVRIDAAEALGRLGRTEAIVPLLENLTHDPCGEVKLACVFALSALDASEALPILRTLVTGRGEEIAWDGDEMYQDEWDVWLDIQIASIRALGRLKDAGAIEPIVQAVYDPEGQELDTVAAEALGSIGTPALLTLGQFASSTSRRRRYHAVRAITTLAGEPAENLLVKATEDDDPAIRTLAFETLLDRNGDVALFETALSDTCEDVRIAALSRLKLDDGVLMDRALRDSSPRVQLALINRFDRASSCSDPEEISFKVLDFLTRSDESEVSASAFGALAARAPDLVSDRLADLFSGDKAEDDDTERRQWAVVDSLAQSRDPFAIKWLQSACHAPFRAVRLKALAALGRMITDQSLSAGPLAQARELVLSIALTSPVIAEAEVSQEEPEEQTEDDRLAIKDAGLDIGDEVPEESQGPTSSLGAILGQESIAQDLVEEAKSDEIADELTNREQALLSRARRNLSRRKVSLDGDTAGLDHEMRLTAIQLLGEQPGMQNILVDIASDDQVDLASTALHALCENVRLHKMAIESEQLDTLLTRVLASTSHTVRLQAVRLAAHIPDANKKLEKMVRNALRDGEASIRAEALRTLCALQGRSDKISELIGDPSPLVRHQAMRLLAKWDPEKAEAFLLDFLLENPEQSIKPYLADNTNVTVRVRKRLTGCLMDEDMKSAWPVIMPALAGVMQLEQQAS